MLFSVVVHRRATMVASLAVWTVALAVGIRILLRYANTPGQPARPPADWPLNAPVKAAQQRATLLLFIHPQCPCSRATLEEMARIVACCKDKVESSVLIYSPSNTGSEWAHTELWNTAAGIPGVHVLADPDASTARRFGARTSGQVLLYD